MARWQSKFGDDRVTRVGIFWLLTLFVIEGFAVIAAFQIFAPIDCRATGIEIQCRGLRSVFVSALCVMSGFGIFMCARQGAWGLFVNLTRESDQRRKWAAVHILGITTIFLPLLIIPSSELNHDFIYVFIALSVGAVLAALGGLFWMLRPQKWWMWLKANSFLLVLICALAAMIPFLAKLIEPLWAIELMSTATFQAVAFLLSALNQDVFVDPVRAWIGLPNFVVAVASQCSGIEGLALITGFMAIYAILFRDTLCQRRFWGVLWPIALTVSWGFNILRITVLIVIGEYVSPDLAVNGFHSFAGWLLFTTLAIGVLFIAQSVPALHGGGLVSQDIGNLRDDPVAALIVPFIAFMLSAVIVQAFWEYPALGYPLQVAIMAGALLWMRRRFFLQIKLSFDPVSIGIGLVVGLIWVWFSDVQQEDTLGLDTLGSTAMIAWVLCRTLGTTLLVPLIEEAFFRGYILARLDTGTALAKAIAIVLSTLLFALLHGRIILAGIAGLLFGAAMLRRGRLGDAVVAHAVANTTVAAVAWLTGQWSLI
jgi:exosortase E/protease (VPEID-CTERM system)